MATIFQHMGSVGGLIGGLGNFTLPVVFDTQRHAGVREQEGLELNKDVT